MTNITKTTTFRYKIFVSRNRTDRLVRTRFIIIITSRYYYYYAVVYVCFVIINAYCTATAFWRKNCQVHFVFFRHYMVVILNQQEEVFTVCARFDLKIARFRRKAHNLYGHVFDTWTIQYTSKTTSCNLKNNCLIILCSGERRDWRSSMGWNIVKNLHIHVKHASGKPHDLRVLILVTPLIGVWHFTV